MNASNDIDRRVADYLADGPSRASERSIAAALGHARSHPRRRDPLAALRRDPMGSSRFGGGAGLRTLPLVAALGLLLVGALAIAAVGGVFDQRPVVVPPLPTASASPNPAPSASPNPAPSASPTSIPSVAPSASPAVIRVDLVDDIGGDAFVEITDQSGTLVSARAGQAGEGSEVVGDVGVTNTLSDPESLVLTWVGSPCDTRHVLTIAPDGKTMTIARTACQGDAMAIGRVLVLTFDPPLPASDVSASLVETGP